MIHVTGNRILFSNGRSQTFPERITEYVFFDDAVVILLDTQNEEHRTNENVLAFDFQGRRVWQIPFRTHTAAFSPYVALYRRGSFVEALNQDGTCLTLNARDGFLVKEGWALGDYRRRHRHRSFI